MTAAETSIDRDFVGLASPVVGRAGAGGHPCQGIYHRPAGEWPTTAFIATHYNVDFSEHYLAEYMAARGFGFLGWNTRFRGAEQHFLLDHALVEIGVGVRWLREVAGVETLVLIGNSGGGSLMGAYQSQAVAPDLTPEYGRSGLVDGLDELLPADLYISLAAHPGRPEVLTNWMDASVVDEFDPFAVDPELDPFDPAHGPPFSEEFQTRYRAAQVARNQRITDWARDEIDRLAAAGHYERLFATPRLWADLRMLDGTIDPSNRPSPGCYLGDVRRANFGVFGVGTVSTLRTWLSMWSLEESGCRGARHLSKIDLPALVVDADEDSGVFPSDTQGIAAALAGDDIEVRTIAGDHYLREPAGARDEAADVIANWVSART